MKPAQLSPYNSASCVYSAQGNMVCQPDISNDPVLRVTHQSCGVRRQVAEPYMNLSDTLNSAGSAFGLNKKQDQFVNRSYQESEHYANKKAHESYYNGGIMDNVKSTMNSMGSMIGMEQKKNEGFEGGIMDSVKSSMSSIGNMLSDKEKFNAEHRPSAMNTAMNVSYSVSPWPF